MAIVARRPPRPTTGPVAWLRTNLFSSFWNGLASVVIFVLLAFMVVELVAWVFTSAHWQQLWHNLKLFAVYRYPADLLWRPLAVATMIMLLLGLTAGAGSRSEGVIMQGVFWWFTNLCIAIALIAVVFWPSVRFTWPLVPIGALLGYLVGRAVPSVVRVLPWLWGASVVVGFLLLSGFGAGGALRRVETREWGGFMLTLILSIVGIAVSFPLGILLALGRKSKLPVIKYTCITFIEIVRGAPLITWLFIASLLVPLLFAISPDKISALFRAMVAVTLFSAAYMAENVRGGLQAVPKGQTEAAQALGLSAFDTTRLIVLPQALRAVIPAIVGQAIGLFKDTSLVFIVGLFDFFNISNVVANQPASLFVPGGIRLELSLFLAAVYWYFAFRMSLASRQLEKQLGVGER